jgi:Protein of unknown function (DUF1566)
MKGTVVGIASVPLAALLVLVPRVALGQCCGDCNGNGAVTVDEILTVVNHALTGCSDDGICSMASCPAQLATCQSDLATCRAQPGAQRFPATGQTTSRAAGDDGAVQAGAPLAYVDNGDGTITDLNTGLMWEKKIQLDGTGNGADLHDADNCYPWGGACAVGAAYCGTDVDCGAKGPCNALDCQGGHQTIFMWVAALNTANFAGHNDWRIPNIKELQSIVDYGNSNPAVDGAFKGASCGPACTDITSAGCSCIKSNRTWSSTGDAFLPGFARSVDFDDGVADEYGKSSAFNVRAVRGGL